jgi:hypothetical protein
VRRFDLTDHLPQLVPVLIGAIGHQLVEGAAVKVTHGELAALSVLSPGAGEREGVGTSGAPKYLRGRHLTEPDLAGLVPSVRECETKCDMNGPSLLPKNVQRGYYCFKAEPSLNGWHWLDLHGPFDLPERPSTNNLYQCATGPRWTGRGIFVAWRFGQKLCGLGFRSELNVGPMLVLRHRKQRDLRHSVFVLITQVL